MGMCLPGICAQPFRYLQALGTSRSARTAYISPPSKKESYATFLGIFDFHPTKHNI